MSAAGKRLSPTRPTAAAAKASPAKAAIPRPTAAASKPAGRKPGVAQVARNVEPRKLTDPRVIRALAHPVRIALLEALLREGPLTATEAAELLADSPGNMSWHLQTLAKYGYVEEAEGGVGRRRPWRLISMGTTYDDDPDDPELSVAATSLSLLGHERSFDRLRSWFGERGGYPPKWQHAWFSTNNLSYLLPEELEQVGNEINAVLARYRDRLAHPDLRPAGSKPVNVVAYGHPIRPTPSGN
jgi:DNA-binding transcriptional ArsR family regulator